MLTAELAVAWTTGWRPHGIIEWTGAGGIAAMAISAGVGCWMRHSLARVQRELLLLLIAVIASVLLLEGGVHLISLAGQDSAFFHTRGPGLHHRFTPSAQDISGIEGVANFRTDRQGIRISGDAPAEAALRLLAIGGSTTECVYLDGPETWPGRVEAALRGAGHSVWMGNAGISGFDTRDHLRFIRDSPLLNCVAVVIIQPGINDLWRYLAGEEDHTNYDRFTENPGTATGPAPPRAPVWTHARLIQIYHEARRPPPKPQSQEGIGGEEYRIRREMRRDAGKTKELPDLSRGLKGYGERMEAIIAACRARGITPLFTTQPVLWTGTPSPIMEARCWFGWLSDGRYLTLPALREAMDAYNGMLKQVCENSNVPCVDLSSLSGNETFFYDDCHFTEAGARAVEQEVMKVLPDMLPATARTD